MPAKKAARRSRISSKRKWSAQVTKHGNALDLEKSVFKKPDAKAIARSLKRSAEQSKRKKAGSYQSAMSMLNFYINCGGKNLSATQKKRLEGAKRELKKIFHREE